MYLYRIVTDRKVCYYWAITDDQAYYKHQRAYPNEASSSVLVEIVTTNNGYPVVTLENVPMNEYFHLVKQTADGKFIELPEIWRKSLFHINKAAWQCYKDDNHDDTIILDEKELVTIELNF